jgi:uncharacterized protein (TIGR02285 family)
MFFIQFLLVSTLLSSQITHSQQVIEWAKYQFPPVFISKGDFVNQGMGDLVFQYLQKHLTSYSHIEYRSSGVRILRDFSLDKLICSTFTSKKGREDNMIFSNPITILPTQNLHYLTDNSKIIDAIDQMTVDGQVSFTHLLKNVENIKIGLNKHRSFGKKVNSLLKQYDTKIIGIDETSGLLGIFKVLKNKRIDITIEYPFVSLFVMRSAGVSLPLNIQPMAEVPEFVKAYIACSKNKQGQVAIDAINSVISDHKARSEYRNIFEEWMPQASLSAYRVGYQRFVNE